MKKYIIPTFLFNLYDMFLSCTSVFNCAPNLPSFSCNFMNHVQRISFYFFFSCKTFSFGLMPCANIRRRKRLQWIGAYQMSRTLLALPNLSQTKRKKTFSPLLYIHYHYYNYFDIVVSGSTETLLWPKVLSLPLCLYFFRGLLAFVFR